MLLGLKWLKNNSIRSTTTPLLSEAPPALKRAPERPKAFQGVLSRLHL